MIYFIQCGENGPIKIGQSDNPEERMAQLQTANPVPLRLIWTYNGEHSESDIHKELDQYRISGEWFAAVETVFSFMRDELSNSHVITLNDGSGFGFIESYGGHLEASFRGTIIFVIPDKEEHGEIYIDSNLPVVVNEK